MQDMREKLNAEAEKALEQVVLKLGNKKEVREEQVKMTQFLRRFLEFAETPEHVALVEAGTGIGKSFAYLTALSEYVQAHSHEKIVIAANTLTLMNQLVAKDIPVLQEIYPDIIFAAAKGRQNYLCLHKFYQTMDTLFSDVPDEEKDALEEALTYSDGERSSLPDVSEPLWRQIRCEARDCLGQECTYFHECYLNRSRWELKDADIIITNHALALIDLLQQPVFPEYRCILFDEAHNLENNAVKSLTTSITISRIWEIHQLADAPECEEAFADSKQSKNLFQWKQKLLALANLFFQSLGLDERDREPKDYTEGWELLYHMESFEEDIQKIREKSSRDKNKINEISVANFYNDLEKVHNDLKTWLEHGIQEAVYWHQNSACFFAPVDLSQQMQAVWEKKNIIFVSATLTVGNTFSHIKKQLGLPDDTTYALKLNSPFSYRDHVLVYQPAEAPSPRWEPENFTGFVADIVEKMLLLTRGHIFVLFTSYKMLQEVYEDVSQRLEDLPLQWLVQGKDSREKMLEHYRNSEYPVLMGTDSYWEGVDEEMDCLIIAKLPFAVPTTPLEQARSELIQNRKENSFQVLSLPKCALKLKQGAGRLIRRKDKKGIIVICDPRIRQNSWGKFIQQSLPSMPWTSQFSDCEKFFKTIQKSEC